MTDTKDFPTLDALSAITGVLVSNKGIGCIYEVLNFMTGENLYTHQLPRVGREAQAFMCKRLAGLAETCEESKLVTRENYPEWQARWLARHGETITVTRMNVDDHESIDSLSELAEKVPPKRRIVLRTR